MENDLTKSIDQLTKDKNYDLVNVHKLIEFLEYEEAYTEDKKTKQRIRDLLVKLKIWKE